MATVPQHNDPDESLSELIEGVSCDRGIRRAAFDVTRILKTVHIDAIQAIKENLKALEDLADNAGYDVDELSEEIYFAWSKVLSASDSDPVTEALQFAKSQKAITLLGSWPPSRKFKNDAGTVYLMACYLSQDGSRAFYLPCRKLAAALGCEHKRGAAILRLLVVNGFLIKDKPATRHTAQFYRLPNP